MAGDGGREDWRESISRRVRKESENGCRRGGHRLAVREAE
jgi:hypothetical protein